MNEPFKSRKCLQQAKYRILKIAKFRMFRLPASQPASLTTVARLEAKQSSAPPPFFATILNSLVTCAFSGSDECLPSALYFSFYLQLRIVFLLQSRKPCQCVNYFKSTLSIEQPYFGHHAEYIFNGLRTVRRNRCLE